MLSATADVFKIDVSAIKFTFKTWGCLQILPRRRKLLTTFSCHEKSPFCVCYTSCWGSSMLTLQYQSNTSFLFGSFYSMWFLAPSCVDLLAGKGMQELSTPPGIL